MAKVSEKELREIPRGQRLPYLLEKGYSPAQARAAVEALRGIMRDADGHIVRSKEWLENRIAYLEGRQEDLENRAKNVVIEIKERKEQLEDAE